MLLVAFKDLEQVLEYTELMGEDFYFYIHIDKKSNISEERINRLRSKNNVKYIGQKFKSNWGGKGLIDVLLFLAKIALKDKEVKYIHTASESDLPLQSPNYIKDFFLKNEGKQFLDIFRLPDKRWPNGGLDRYNLFNFYDEFDAKTKIGFKIIMVLLKIQKLVGVNRNIIKKCPPLYGGSIWGSLSVEAMDYCIKYVNNHPIFWESLKYTFAPEEIIFQTILMQSPFRDNIINDNLFYIDWNFRNGNSPAHLDLSDFDKLKASNKLFARKIYSPVSDSLKIELKKYLNSK